MRGSAALVLAVAAVAGAGTMVVELAAVRLLAPWFGASLVVWTNVIAVVLLALALGYLLGGRLSARGRPLERLGTLLGVAAAWTAALPFLAGPVTGLFLPERLALHEAAEVLAWSSLASACLLFIPPAALLGAVAPLAVEAVQAARGGHAGRAGGLVLGTSTLGSLAGVFGTSHVLLPRLGLGGTHLVAAAALAAAALLALVAARAGPRALVLGLPLALGVALGARSGPREPASGDVRTLASAESAYQSVRIVEDRSYEPPLRFLQVNEGFDSYQSVWQPEPGLLPEGFYYDAFALPPAWSAPGPEEAAGGPLPWRLLVLGLGGGTVFRVLEGTLPEGLRLEATGVEIDPVVVTLAERWLDLEPEAPGTRVVAGLDARAALRALPGPYDQVVVDCYANQVEIPPHLATLELFREVRARLAPGGWICVNVGGFGFDDPVVLALARTLASALDGRVLGLRVPAARNVVLFARADAPLPLEPPGPEDGGAGGAGSAGGPRLPGGPLDAWLAPLRLPGGWRLYDAAGPGLVLTDRRSPTELLEARSLREARERLGAELP